MALQVTGGVIRCHGARQRAPEVGGCVHRIQVTTWPAGQPAAASPRPATSGVRPWVFEICLQTWWPREVKETARRPGGPCRPTWAGAAGRSGETPSRPHPTQASPRGVAGAPSEGRAVRPVPGARQPAPALTAGAEIRPRYLMAAGGAPAAPPPAWAAGRKALPGTRPMALECWRPPRGPQDTGTRDGEVGMCDRQDAVPSFLTGSLGSTWHPLLWGSRRGPPLP